MTEQLQRTITEEVAKLPAEHREAVSSVDWIKITEEIGVKYAFDAEVLTDLQTETLLVLLGLEEPTIFATNLENHAGTGDEESRKIAEEVTQRIFIPVNNAFLEKIKQSDRLQDTWLHNVNFILSNGNYSELLDTRPASSQELANDIMEAAAENRRYNT